MPARKRFFTVICQWQPGTTARGCSHTVVVVLRSDFDARDAADEACLFLIWQRQGQAQPLLVIEGVPRLTVPGAGIFDAAEYAETITFAREIICCYDLA